MLLELRLDSDAHLVKSILRTIVESSDIVTKVIEFPTKAPSNIFVLLKQLLGCVDSVMLLRSPLPGWEPLFDTRQSALGWVIKSRILPWCRLLKDTLIQVKPQYYFGEWAILVYVVKCWILPFSLHKSFRFAHIHASSDLKSILGFWPIPKYFWITCITAQSVRWWLSLICTYLTANRVRYKPKSLLLCMFVNRRLILTLIHLSSLIDISTLSPLPPFLRRE